MGQDLEQGVLKFGKVPGAGKDLPHRNMYDEPLAHITLKGKPPRQFTLLQSTNGAHLLPGFFGNPALKITTRDKALRRYLERPFSRWFNRRPKSAKVKGDLSLLGECHDGLSKVQKPSYAIDASNSGSVETTSATLQLQAVIEHTAEVRTFRLTTTDGSELPLQFLPGQYFSLGARLNGKIVKRAFSVSSSPLERNFIDFTIKRELKGTFTNWMFDELKVGDSLDIVGPYGHFIFTGSENDHILMLSGGVGITPFMSMLRFLHDTDWRGEITMLASFRDGQNELFRPELEAFAAQNPRFHLFIFLTDAPKQYPHRGLLTLKRLKKHAPKAKTSSAYICGPTAMSDAFVGMLKKAGVPKDKIHTESFTAGEDDPTLGGNYNITFQPSGISIASRPGQSLLDAADQSGIFIDYSCRAGSCGTCVARLISGEVEQINNEALTDKDLADQFILTCQSYPVSDIEVQL